ncbi:MAG: hypothetical protein MJ151_03790, partial [Lachnospiraceae bacterium]|nr:hypothetical protein [Lachnospiraceae bacterium]
MKKTRIVPCIFVVFSIVSIVALSFACYASVIYKDITSISIRTKYNFDYESIQSDSGIPDIEIADQNDGEAIPDFDDNQVGVWTNTNKYYIESAEWYDNDMREFSVGGQPKIICY